MSAASTRVRAIARKEFLHLGRDRRILAMVVLLPILQLLLFSYALGYDIDEVPTIIIDQDQTPTSQTYVQRYEQSTFFTVVEHASSPSAVDTAFDQGTAQVAVLIPAGFADTILAGGQAEVGVLIDGSEPNAARVARSYSVALNQLLSVDLTRQWAADQGIDLSSLGSLEPRIRTWYNPDRSSADFLIPGLMVVIIAILTIQQTAVTLVRERALGTEEQLMISPMHKIELMVGKVIPWAAIAMIDFFAIGLIGVYGMGVPLRGNLLALLLAAVLFIVSCLGMGLAISAIAPSEDTASIMAMLIALLPSFLLSGFVFPIEQMPVAIQAVTYIFPARYMVTLSRGVFLRGEGFVDLWPDLVALTITTVVFLGLSTVLYDRRSRR